MKFTSSHITGLLILVGITGLSTHVKAQENRPFPEPEVIIKETKIDLTSPESESNTTYRPQRDSVQLIVKPAPKPTKTGEKGTL